MRVYFDYLNGNDSKVLVQDDNIRVVEDIYHYISNALKFYDKNIEYTWEYKNGFCDNVVNFYDTKNNSLPIGLIARLCDILKMAYPGITFGLSSRIRSMFTPPVKISDEEILRYVETLNVHDRFDGTKYTPYDHQLRLINVALNHRRGSLMACTSAGKSLSIFTLARYLNDIEHKKVLVIVPSKALVEQLYRNFHDDYGWDEAEENCTLIYSESKDKIGAKQKKALAELGMGEDALLKPITISTWQSLQYKEPSFFKPFQAVIVDEAHGMRGDVLRGIVDCCVNAENFKIGVSGTLPDNGIDAGYIESCLGKKYEIVRLKELVDKGILTPVNVVSLFVPYPEEHRKFICNSKFQEEYSVVTNNNTRYDIMDMLIDSKQITLEQNTVILFKNKTPIKLLSEYMKEHHPEFTYHIIEGDVKVKERSKICMTLENTNGNILIGTYGCLQQGINVKNLHNLVFGEPAKSVYMIMQSIGRIVRPKKGKTHATCYDIVDDASYVCHGRTRGDYLKENYMVRHYRLREEYYSSDDIPITQVKLDGIIQARIDVENVKQKRKAKALAVAANPKSKNKFKVNYRRQF